MPSAIEPPGYDPSLLALKVEEAARRLSIGRTTMYELIKGGEIETVPIGRARRVTVAALIAYLATHSNNRTQNAA